MSEYLTEEEQVERLKEWWRENGRSIIVGVVIGLGIFGGWQGWQGYRQQQAETGSAAYDRFARAARSADLDGTLAAESELRAAFDDSAYADFAELETARQLVTAGRLDEAAERLRRVQSVGANTALRSIAGLRLARVLIAQSKYDEAGAALGNVPAAFAAEAAVLRGDAARLSGDAAAARSAYQEARKLGAGGDWLDLMLEQVDGESAG